MSSAACPAFVAARRSRTATVASISPSHSCSGQHAHRARGLSCDVEVEVLSIDGDRRADVLLNAPGDGYRVALEVQNSTLDYATLERRTCAYLAAGVAVICVSILIRKRLGEPSRIAGTEIFYVSRYSAPPWQLCIHDLQGQLWFYDPVACGVWRGMLDRCMLYRNPTSWIEDGDEHSAGGIGMRRNVGAASFSRDHSAFLNSGYDA